MNRVFMLDKSFEDLDLLVVEWAREKGILQVADAKSQALKMVSEVGELCDAIAKGDMVNIIDGLGDVAVTLIILAELQGLDLTECLEVAYGVIKERKGSMRGGVFVKEVE